MLKNYQFEIFIRNKSGEGEEEGEKMWGKNGGRLESGFEEDTYTNPLKLEEIKKSQKKKTKSIGASQQEYKIKVLTGSADKKKKSSTKNLNNNNSKQRTSSQKNIKESSN